MPRYAQVQLRWSPQSQIYMLFFDDQSSTQAFTSEWLEQQDSFAFQSQAGHHATVRKQKGQRAGDCQLAPAPLVIGEMD